MKTIVKLYCLFFSCLLYCATISAQSFSADDLEKNFLNPPASAKPWVFWYWMHAAVSKEGITADLEAMKEVGIGGAYLMPIKDTFIGYTFSTNSKAAFTGMVGDGKICDAGSKAA